MALLTKKKIKTLAEFPSYVAMKEKLESLRAKANAAESQIALLKPHSQSAGRLAVLAKAAEMIGDAPNDYRAAAAQQQKYEEALEALPVLKAAVEMLAPKVDDERRRCAAEIKNGITAEHKSFAKRVAKLVDDLEAVCAEEEEFCAEFCRATGEEIGTHVSPNLEVFGRLKEWREFMKERNYL